MRHCDIRTIHGCLCHPDTRRLDPEVPELPLFIEPMEVKSPVHTVNSWNQRRPRLTPLLTPTPCNHFERAADKDEGRVLKATPLLGLEVMFHIVPVERNAVLLKYFIMEMPGFQQHHIHIFLMEAKDLDVVVRPQTHGEMRC